MTPYAHSVRHITREAVPNGIYANKRFEEILSMNDKQQSATISFDFGYGHTPLKRFTLKEKTLPGSLSHVWPGRVLQGIKPSPHCTRSYSNFECIGWKRDCWMQKQQFMSCRMQKFETNDYIIMFHVAALSIMCINTAVTRRQIAKWGVVLDHPSPEILIWLKMYTLQRQQPQRHTPLRRNTQELQPLSLS